MIIFCMMMTNSFSVKMLSIDDSSSFLKSEVSTLHISSTDVCF